MKLLILSLLLSSGSAFAGLVEECVMGNRQGVRTGSLYFEKLSDSESKASYHYDFLYSDGDGPLGYQKQKSLGTVSVLRKLHVSGFGTSVAIYNSNISGEIEYTEKRVSGWIEGKGKFTFSDENNKDRTVNVNCSYYPKQR